jgi:putative transposon-encoded protein
MEKQQYRYNGYSTIEKKPVNGGSSGRVFVPLSWVGKKIVVILLEDIED